MELRKFFLDNLGAGQVKALDKFLVFVDSAMHYSYNYFGQKAILTDWQGSVGKFFSKLLMLVAFLFLSSFNIHALCINAYSMVILMFTFHMLHLV